MPIRLIFNLAIIVAVIIFLVAASRRRSDPVATREELPGSADPDRPPRDRIPWWVWLNPMLLLAFITGLAVWFVMADGPVSWPFGRVQDLLCSLQVLCWGMPAFAAWAVLARRAILRRNRLGPGDLAGLGQVGCLASVFFIEVVLGILAVVVLGLSLVYLG